MKFQKGDHILFDGSHCVVELVADGQIVFRRKSDCYLMMYPDRVVESEQMPWVIDANGRRPILPH